MRSTSLTTIIRSLELLFPKECLVCRRPLKGHCLCFRCTPTPLRGDIGLQSRCPVCFGPHIQASSESSACPTCLTFPPLPDRIRFLWEYEGLTRDLIRTMKYRPSPRLTRIAGTWMASYLPVLFSAQHWDVVAPIPSSPLSYYKRLFHPCAELARLISRASPGSHYANLLQHSTHRSPQALRTHEERLRKLQTLFECASVAQTRGRRILLVEDVITTGATIAAAAFTLRRAGAIRIDVLALARTQVWHRFRSRIHALFPA